MIGGSGGRNDGNEKAANDNEAAEARVQAAVTLIAHLLGRQIAREQFERLCAANDNRPESESGDRKER